MHDADDAPQVLHGVCLRNAPPIAGALTDPTGADHAFVVGVTSAADDLFEDPPGALIAARAWERGGFAASRSGTSVRVRFSGAADFAVDLDRGTISARCSDGVAATLVPLFLSGVVLSTVLGLRDVAVMHASAVELGGRAVAFAGHAGAGKSTAAALLCAAGGRLVTDDTARVEDGEHGLVVHRGPAQVRLRTGSEALARRVRGALSQTADGRTGVITDAPGPVVALGAVVLPAWDAEATAPTVRRLEPALAFQRLLRYPRVGGWLIPGPHPRALRALRADRRAAAGGRAAAPEPPDRGAGPAGRRPERTRRGRDREPHVTLAPMTNLVAIASPDPGELEEAHRRVERAGLTGPWTPAAGVLVAFEPLPGPSPADRAARAAGLYLAHGADALAGHDWTRVARALTGRASGIEALPGDFGALQVGEHGAATVVRAPSGLVPFYVSGAGSRWTVATTLDLMLRFHADALELDPLVNAIWTAGYDGTVERRTFLAGVSLVPRGGRARLGHGAPAFDTWWHPRERAARTPVAEHGERLRAVLLDALERELDPDAENLLSLSGGVDSCALAALAAGTLGRPVRTFTLLSHVAEDRIRDEQHLVSIEAAVPLRRGARTVQTADRLLELVGGPDVAFHVPQAYLGLLPEAAAGSVATVHFGGDFADHLFGSVLGRYDWSLTTSPLALARAWRALPEGPLNARFWFRHRARRRVGRALTPWAAELPTFVHETLRSEYRSWFEARRAEASRDRGRLPYLTMQLQQEGFLGMHWEVASACGLRRCAPFISRASIELAYDCDPREHLVPGTKRLLRRALAADVPAMNLQRPDKGIARPHRPFSSRRWAEPVPDVLASILKPGWPPREPMPYFSVLRGHQLISFANSYELRLKRRSA